MSCPHCASTTTTERPDRTALGYRRFRCRSCNRGFNERTGTLFNHLQFPTDVICFVVLWRFRYKLICEIWPKCFFSVFLVNSRRASSGEHDLERTTRTRATAMRDDHHDGC